MRSFVCFCLLGLFFAACFSKPSVSGEMFIVTRGAGNYKMGGVQVAAVKEGDFEGAIAEKSSRLKSLIDQLGPKQIECENTGTTYTEQLGRDICRLDVAKLRLEISDLYFAAMPKPAATATTDSDGEFKITLPSFGKYIIVAKASRDAGRTTEAYLWIVPVEVVGEEQTVTLSSNNLWEPEQAGI